MEIFQTLLAARIVFILGILNFLLFLLLLLSCRCVPMLSGFGKKWLEYPPFKRFYQWHCWLWLILLAAMVIHMVFAIGLLGIPF
jgi:hypothetical protein